MRSSEKPSHFNRGHLGLSVPACLGPGALLQWRAMTALVFLLSFVSMEFIAWALHKYVMHGFLWSWHQDHHVPTGQALQKNDRFAWFFALPSALLISLGGQSSNPVLSAAGYGMMAYGAVYFLVHEAIIHRRFRFIRGRGRYFQGLIRAHHHHHSVRTKEGAFNFGMLLVPMTYFQSRSTPPH